MKKILILFVALAMTFPMCAYAEVPNIDSLSKEELLELNTAICRRLGEFEDIKPFVVPRGYWTVGEDIPAGTYKISCLPGTVGASFSVDGKTNDGYRYIESVREDMPLISVILVEGATVKISVNDLLFSPAEKISLE